MAQFCSNCGRELQPNARFCTSCGAKSDEPTAAPNQAPEAPVSTGASFIPKMTGVGNKKAEAQAEGKAPVDKMSTEAPSVKAPIKDAVDEAPTDDDRTEAAVEQAEAPAEGPNALEEPVDAGQTALEHAEQQPTQAPTPVYNTAPPVPPASSAYTVPPAAGGPMLRMEPSNISGSPKKKSNTGLIVGIAAAVLLVCIGGIVFGVKSMLSKRVNADASSEIYMVASVAPDGTPVGGAVSSYTPDTEAFTVYGTLPRVKKNTPVRLVWQDDTEGWTLQDEDMIVYTDENGSFFGSFDCAANGYVTEGITYPGDYSVAVYLDDDKKEHAHISFGVYSSGEGRQLYSELFNDFYMISAVSDGNYDVVDRYPEGTTTLMAELSFIQAPAGTQIYDRWYFMENGSWKELLFDNSGELYTITEEGGSNLYDVFISNENGCASGQYKVELYLTDDTLAAERVFEVGTGTSSGAVAVTKLYVSDDMEGWNEADVFPNFIEKLYCQAALEGAPAGTQLSLTLSAAETGDILMSDTVSLTEDNRLIYEIKDTDFSYSGFDLGQYHLTVSTAGIGGTGLELASTDFVIEDYLENNGEPTEIQFSHDEWIELNAWLFIFTDSRLPLFYSVDELTDEQKIDFAVIWNLIGGYEAPETLDDYGYYWVSEEDVNYTLDFLFDLPAIDNPISTALVTYDNGSFGTHQENIDYMPYIFPQVKKLYDCGAGYYFVTFDVYSVSTDFDGDFNGSVEDWQSATEMPEYLGEMMATYRDVDEDGQYGLRRILQDYQWN